MYFSILVALGAIVVGSIVLWVLSSAQTKAGLLLGKPIPGPKAHPIFGHAPLVRPFIFYVQK